MNTYLPEIFLCLLGLAMLAYVILDGYDLGVGILLRRAEPHQKHIMIASIGPFWDANETWLVLGVGILLTVFPKAHGVILGALYVPVVLMLAGLTLRGVAFEFRAKAKLEHRPRWDHAFCAGSWLTALAQGYMLGKHVLGYATGWLSTGFALCIALALSAAYCLLGATWLIIKTEGTLQVRAVRWAQGSLWLTMLGILAISAATPLVSARIFERWFSLPGLLYLLPIPLCTAWLFWWCHRALKRLKSGDLRLQGRPFIAACAIMFTAFLGLAYSLFPYLVVDSLTIWNSHIAASSMQIILVGAVVALPMVVFYTWLSYRVFWGKAQQLKLE
jgi:cytochrome bd ubiquinol oxidase subunit II